MLKTLQKRKSEGFTIIEVLVVLAIAGLIMVVVFLAVPALQRSGRNNALNTSANNILTAVGNYISNNGGSFPTTPNVGTPPSSGVVTFGAGNAETAKVDAGVTSVVVDNGSSPISTSSNLGVVEVVTGTNALCNATSTGLGTAGTASARSYVVLFVAEGGSGKILKCIGS